MNDHTIAFHPEGDARNALEAYDPQAGPKVFTTRSTFRKEVEAKTVIDDRAHELIRLFRAGIESDRSVEFVSQRLVARVGARA